MRQGRIALSFATLLARSTGNPVPHLDFPSLTQCYGIAQGQLAYYRTLEWAGHVRIITDLAGLNRHMAGWESWDTMDDPDDADGAPPLGFVISMEGADPILDPAQLQEWWEAGLRVLGITHFGSGHYAGGTGVEPGLTKSGVALLAEMERLGMILDITHSSDQSFWQSLDQYNGPVLASHNNCRRLVPHQRQLSDEQLKALFERDGVIGAVFDVWMLDPYWTTGGRTNENVTIADVADHIDHVCQLAGNSRHAAIGSDLDGGFGREQVPHDLDTIADLQRLAELLADRGYTDSDIAAIMHGNWLRLLRQSWSA
jgi:membrane dipeptidase